MWLKSDMELKILDQYYGLADKSASDSDFLYNLYQYVAQFYIDSQLKALIKEVILPSNKSDLARFRELEEKLAEEAKTQYQPIKTFIKQNRISVPSVLKAIDEFDSLIDGSLWISGSMPANLNSQITLILIRLLEADEKAKIFAQGFATIDEHGNVSKWNWSKYRDEYDEEKFRLERVEPTKPWFWWYKMEYFYEIFTNYEKHWHETRKNHDFFEIHGIMEAVSELNKILEGHRLDKYYFFEPEILHRYLQQFHLYVISHLSSRHESTISQFTQTSNSLVAKSTPTVPTTATKKGLWLKWNVLKPIWSVYESNSRADSIMVPVDRVTIGGRDPEIIDGIIEGISSDGGFKTWERKGRYYTIQQIDHHTFPEIFNSTGQSYKGTNAAQQSLPPPGNDSMKWYELELNLKTGVCFYKDKRVSFKTGKPPFKILSMLMKNRGEVVSYEVFLSKLAIYLPEKDNEKANKDWIRTKVRGLRRTLGISAKTNPQDDIFHWTGIGCELIQPKHS